ncbi:hypothetical protein [Liquorilactobacillus uvarum]|uniref:hypothetical protein n=1 Tax=Liquorilactobacillus uvarum TaxID=303240 RepID=UPI00288AC0E1|nr:hypothetical protein [Liquorilactobacillus uvarum]
MAAITKKDTYQSIFDTQNGRNYLDTLESAAKITSGQSFLYTKSGARSMVFKIRLTENIDQQLLQRAVNLSLQRFPYFTSKLIEKNSVYCLARNDLPVIVAETDELRELGSRNVNEHLIDIIFKAENIFISYHHAITDGKGIKPFIETILYYYFALKTRTLPSIDEVSKNDEPLKPGELLEPFENFQQGKEEKQKIPQINHNGHQLLESKHDELGNKSCRYELIIDQNDFIHFAKTHNASLAIALAIMLQQAVRKAYPYTELPIVANMASDLRQGAVHKNSFRNCVGSIALACDTNILNDKDFTVLATKYRKLIQEHKQPASLKADIAKMIHLFDKLDSLKTHEAKQEMFSFFDKMIINSFILSYSGQTKLGNFEKYIDEMHTYMSGTKGLSVQVLATNGKIFVDMQQSFNSNVYCETLSQILDEYGINHKASEGIMFETPHAKF